jgi:hypothetical protein
MCVSALFCCLLNHPSFVSACARASVHYLVTSPLGWLHACTLSTLNSARALLLCLRLCAVICPLSFIYFLAWLHHCALSAHALSARLNSITPPAYPHLFAGLCSLSYYILSGLVARPSSVRYIVISCL